MGPLNARVVAWAAPCGGVISRRRLLAHGVSHDVIDGMLARGELWEIHRGVYAAGRPDVTHYGRAWAAMLATRGHGRAQHVRALGHRSAAAAAGIGSHPVQPEVVVVDAVLDIPGVVTRRTRSLRRDEIVVDRNGLAWTRWSRTMTDLPAISTPREIEDYLDRSDRLGLLDVALLEQAMVRANGRAGLRKLRRALELYRELPRADYLSRLERLANRVLLPAGVPQPEVNGAVRLLTGHTIRVDLLFRDAGLAIELDGSTHDAARQRRIDRWRDRELQKLGITVLRFTWFDVTREPERFVADVRLFHARAHQPLGVGDSPPQRR